MFNWLKRKKSRKKQIYEKNDYLPVSIFDTDLRKRINQLEKTGEKVSHACMSRFEEGFKRSGLTNLIVQVSRDIDGDPILDQTSERCFDREYRSVIDISFDGIEEHYTGSISVIELWYLSSGYSKTPTGFIYRGSEKDMEAEVIITLTYLLEKVEQLPLK